MIISNCATLFLFFFLMIRRPPRSTLDRSSAASDVYKRQAQSRGYLLFDDILAIWPQAEEQIEALEDLFARVQELGCLLYTSPSPRDRTRSRMPSSA